MGVQHLGEYLVTKGLVSAPDLIRALDVHDPDRLGALAVAKGILLQEELDMLHDYYGYGYIKLGKKAVRHKRMTQEQLDYLLRLQKNDAMVLGATLARLDLLDANRFGKALREYRKHQMQYVLREQAIPKEMAGRSDMVALITMTETVFFEVLHCPIFLSEAELCTGPSQDWDFIMCVETSGEYLGRYTIAVEPEVANELYRFFWGQAPTPTQTRDIHDTVGELCNMVVGNAASSMARLGHELNFGTPTTPPASPDKESLAIRFELISSFGIGEVVLI